MLASNTETMIVNTSDDWMTEIAKTLNKVAMMPVSDEDVDSARERCQILSGISADWLQDSYARNAQIALLEAVETAIEELAMAHDL